MKKQQIGSFTRVAAGATTFANSFPSERHLTEAVAELLRKMGREGVQIIHGAQEYGKDIVFYAYGGFQEPRLYACVIKNLKLNGNMNSDNGTRAVFHQAQAAFDTPFIADKGHVEFVETVYVITPHDCSQTAISAICGRLKERSGQVTFLCGSALFDLFVKYWPDFVFFDSGTLTAYLSTLSKTISIDTAFANLVRRYSLLSDTVRPLTHVYVQRGFRKVLLTYTFAQPRLPLIALDKPMLFFDMQRICAELTTISDHVKSLLTHAKLRSSISERILGLAQELQRRWTSDFDVYKRKIIEGRESYRLVFGQPR